MTIQNIYTISELNQLGIILLIVFCAIALVSLIFIFVFGETDHAGAAVFCFVLTAIFFVMTVVVFSCSLPKTYNEIPYYEITLDDGYPTEKLIEQYDVKEVRGHIFICRDKDAG